MPAKQQDMIYATQSPASQTVFADTSGALAWKTKPSWYIVSKSDGAISPVLERFMAKRINAKTTEIDASHVVMMSYPKEVLNVIEADANAAVK